MKKVLKLLIKKSFSSFLYKYKPIGLSAGKLYNYLDALKKTNHLNGAVVEIGCNLCGTSALGAEMLRKLKSSRTYYAIDTFGGFVKEQFEFDKQFNSRLGKEYAFSSNSIGLARKILKLHNASEVKLIQSDIVKFDINQLSENISMALLDVDLYQPIKSALQKIYPRLETDGIILVDDCGNSDKDNSWKAGLALKEFAEEQGIQFRMEFGMGIIQKYSA